MHQLQQCMSTSQGWYGLLANVHQSFRGRTQKSKKLRHALRAPCSWRHGCACPTGPTGWRAQCATSARSSVANRGRLSVWACGMECCTDFGDLKPVIKDHVSLIPADNSCFVCGSVHLSGWRPPGASWTPNPYRFWLKDTWGCKGMGTSANCTNKISMAEPRWACLGCCHQTGLVFFRCNGPGWRSCEGYPEANSKNRFK